VRRSSTFELFVFAILVFVGTTARLQFQDLPNFAPVAALALFSGYFFRSRWLAIAAPVLVMLLSDAMIGTYHPVLMVAVYTMLALPVVFRDLLRRTMDVQNKSARQAGMATLGLIGCGVVSSLAFFVVTNFATWIVGGLYEHTWHGLTRCFIQAIPFFRYTVAGDLAFAVALFGSYALVSNYMTVRRTSAAHA
jgi:hypothetical protein